MLVLEPYIYGTYKLVMTYKKGVEMRAKTCIIRIVKREGIKMKCLEKHTRLIIAVLVLIIAMLGIALWESTYINKVDDYYFKEYLREADTLEQ